MKAKGTLSFCDPIIICGQTLSMVCFFEYKLHLFSGLLFKRSEFMPNQPYNILFITSDHHRGDALSCLDHPIARTPHLDKLAQQGVLFRRAYSECPVCIPARMSIMTGRRPGTGEQTIGYNYYEECSPILPEVTLPKVLGDAGYQTQAVGKMHFFPQRRRYGFDNMLIEEEGRILPGLSKDDYEFWLQEQGYVGSYHTHGVGNNEVTSRNWHLPEYAHPTSWTAREACRWFERRDPDAQFFLWTSFSAPHPPYTPPDAYWDLFKDAPVDAPTAGDWISPEELPAEFLRAQLPGNYDLLTGAWYERTVRAYHALVNHIDAQISLLVGTLREKNLLNNTIILYTSDHGDMMGDFGTFAKRLFYEGAANIPFILVLPPGHPDYRYGEVLHQPVGLQDVLPTLLDAAGVEIPEKMSGVSALQGLRNPAQARNLIHGNYTKGPNTADANHMITDGHMKYIWYNEGDIEQLFDLQKDPRELENLARNPEYQELTAQWRRKLIAVLEEEDSFDVRNGELVDIPYPKIDRKKLRSIDIFNPRGMHL